MITPASVSPLATASMMRSKFIITGVNAPGTYRRNNMNAVVCAPGTAMRRPASASTDMGSRASTMGPYLRPTDAPHDMMR